MTNLERLEIARKEADETSDLLVICFEVANVYLSVLELKLQLLKERVK